MQTLGTTGAIPPGVASIVLRATQALILEELRSLRTEVETLRRERASVEG